MADFLLIFKRQYLAESSLKPYKAIYILKVLLEESPKMWKSNIIKYPAKCLDPLKIRKFVKFRILRNFEGPEINVRPFFKLSNLAFILFYMRLQKGHCVLKAIFHVCEMHNHLCSPCFVLDYSFVQYNEAIALRPLHSIAISWLQHSI